MDYKLMNRIRKKFLPAYIISLILTAVVLGVIITNLVVSKPKNHLLYYIVSTILSFGAIIGAVMNNVILLNWYEATFIIFLRPLYLDNYLKEQYNLKFIQEQEINLKESLLINNHHSYKIVRMLESDKYYLCEISMLSDMRFHGYALIIKDNIMSKAGNFVITNYKYYYHHKPKGMTRNKEVPKQFASRYKLFQDVKYTFNGESLNLMLPYLSNFKQVGLSNINNKLTFLFSFKDKDNSNIFVPSLFETINLNYETILNATIQRILKLTSINIR